MKSLRLFCTSNDSATLDFEMLEPVARWYSRADSQAMTTELHALHALPIRSTASACAQRADIVQTLQDFDSTNDIINDKMALQGKVALITGGARGGFYWMQEK